MTNGTLKLMMRPKYKGHVLEIDLSKFGHKEYFVECCYYFDKHEEKYALSLYLNRNDLDDRMKISSKGIDTQYISGTRETIVENICRVVHQMYLGGHFDYYVERYEHELNCFDRGNELLEQERLNQSNDKE